MSVSIVYTSNNLTSINVEKFHKPLIGQLLEYLIEFLTNNPTTAVYNENTTRSDSSDVRFEIKFVDQTQLDLYLTDSRNMKSLIDNFNADPANIAFCTTNQCTLNISLVHDTTTSLGIVSIAELVRELTEVYEY